MKPSSNLVFWFDKLTRWSDNLILILSVFACTFFVYKSFNLRMILGFFVLTLILGIHILRRIILKRCVKLSPVKIAFLFMAAVILIYFFLPNANRNRDTVSYMISMVICTGYLLFAEVSEKEVKLIGKTVIAFAVLFSLYVLLCGIFPNVYWWFLYPHLSKPTQVMAFHYIPLGYGVPVGGSYTFVDYVIALAFPIAIGFILVKVNSKLKLSVLMASLYLFFAAAVIEDRRGEFAALLLTFALIYIVTVNFKNIKEFKKRLLGGVASALTLVILFVGIGVAGLAPRYISTLKIVFKNLEHHAMSEKELAELEGDYDFDEMEDLEEVDISSGRTELWGIAFDLFKEHPVTGIGWSGFAKHVPAEFNEAHANGGNKAVLNVHNTYLQFLCETGIVGTLLILTPLIYIFAQTGVQTIRLVKRRKEEKFKFAIICNTASFGIQCFFLAINVIDMAFYHYKFWAFYVVGVALAETALRFEGYAFGDFFTNIFRRISLKKPALCEESVKND